MPRPRSLFDRTEREELRRRMESIRPDARPLWGKMSAGKMLAHVNAGLAMATGELPTRPKRSPLANPLGRWLIIYKLKWPQGSPTAPELLDVSPGEWEADLARFRELLEANGARDPAGEWPRHPAFGRMTGREWGDLGWKHIDHHLRQFGV
jgi:uncharacterized protein DUF1569